MHQTFWGMSLPSNFSDGTKTWRHTRLGQRTSGYETTQTRLCASVSHDVSVLMNLTNTYVGFGRPQKHYIPFFEALPIYVVSPRCIWTAMHGGFSESAGRHITVFPCRTCAKPTNWLEACFPKRATMFYRPFSCLHENKQHIPQVN